MGSQWGLVGMDGKELFERFPFGILIAEPDGTLVSVNPNARDLLGLDASAPRPVTCCDLLLCRRHDGPTGGQCISALASAAGEPLPEMRINLAPRGLEQAVWATASASDPVPGRVLIHLRPGDVRDRRRRTQPHWLSGPELRIGALGRTSIESVEGPIGGAWVDRRAGQILKFLVSRRGAVAHTDEIAEALWPEASPRVAGTVRHFVHVLRETLEPRREKRKPSSFIVFANGGYSLDPNHVAVDVDEFEAAVEDGLEALRRDQTDVAREQLGRATDLYRGDFIADEPYADWALTPRELVRGHAVEAFRALAELDIAAGKLAEATRLLVRLADMQPFDAHTHAPLISLLLQRGHRSEAVRRYGALRTRLLRQFGEEPDFVLADL